MKHWINSNFSQIMVTAFGAFIDLIMFMICAIIAVIVIKYSIDLLIELGWYNPKWID